MYTGSCLCGSVQFEVNQAIDQVQICHCAECRKAQGSAFATNAPIDKQNFRLVTGESHIGSFESSPGKQRCFCKNCGSPIYSKLAKLPDILRLRVGTLDGDVDTKPIAHFWVSDKANWLPISDDLPQFEKAYVPPK